MPRTYLMNFDAGGKRWRKTYRGIKYEVYMRDLPVTPAQWTEMGSYQAANDWWKGKLAEIQKAHPHARVAELVQPRIAYAERHGMTDEANANKELLAEVLNVSSAELPPLVAKISLGGTDLADSAVWADRFAREPHEPTPKPTVNIGTALNEWFEVKKIRAKASSVVMLSSYLDMFRAMLGEEVPVSSIDEDCVAKLFIRFHEREAAAATKRKWWMYMKNFVRHASQRYRFPLPTNLDNREYGWAVEVTEKQEVPARDILAFLQPLPDRLKLYALLAWNTGMTNIDIAGLVRDQLDLDAGTLVRRRTKTGDWSRVPKVRYGLWAETVRLLRQEMATDGERALLDAKGKPLYEANKAGAGKLYDKVKSQWRDTLGRHSARPYTLKDFRDFGSMLLQNSDFRSYRTAWLGHSPGSVADRHYSGTENVVAACRWMEQQIWPQTVAEDQSRKAAEEPI